MRSIVVIGAGGHSKVIRDIINATHLYKIIAILDDKYKDVTIKGSIRFAPITYSLDLIKEIKPAFVIAIGNNVIRKKIATKLIEQGAELPVLVHPTAVVSSSTKLGAGTVVMPKSVINADCVIGEQVIINSAAVIEHDNTIESYCHISPGSILTGNVKVGEGTHIGAGTTVVPGKRIGKWSIIGAASTIIHDIPDKVTVVGTPGKIIKHIN